MILAVQNAENVRRWGGELERHLVDMHINRGPAGRTDWKRKGFEDVDVSVYMQCEAKELVMTSFALN